MDLECRSDKIEISKIRADSIRTHVDYLYRRDLELMAYSAREDRKSYRDFSYYSGTRPAIAPHMINEFKKNGFKVRILFWKTFYDLFNDLTCGTIHIRVYW